MSMAREHAMLYTAECKVFVSLLWKVTIIKLAGQCILSPKEPFGMCSRDTHAACRDSLRILLGDEKTIKERWCRERTVTLVGESRGRRCTLLGPSRDENDAGEETVLRNKRRLVPYLPLAPRGGKQYFMLSLR